jgi:hypothetical protein
VAVDPLAGRVDEDDVEAAAEAVAPFAFLPFSFFGRVR